VTRRRRTEVPPREVVERHELRPVGAHRLFEARPLRVRGGALHVEGLIADDHTTRPLRLHQLEDG